MHIYITIKKYVCDFYKFINKSSILSRLPLRLFRLLIFYNLIFSKKRENLIYIKKVNNLFEQFITRMNVSRISR